MFDKFLIHGIQTTHGDVHGITKSGTEKRGKGEIYHTCTKLIKCSEIGSNPATKAHSAT